MEATKKNIKKGLGIITICCALLMAGLNLGMGKNINDYIFPFILLMAGIIFISQKQKTCTTPI